MVDRELVDGTPTEQPDTAAGIPEVTPQPGDPMPEGGDPEPVEGEPAPPQPEPGVLPLEQVTQLTGEMATEIGSRFTELFPGQLAEIDAQRDRSFYLDGERNGWRVDLVLRVRLRRG